MLIFGAKGLVKQILDDLTEVFPINKVLLFDDVTNLEHIDLEKYCKIVRSWSEIKDIFKLDPLYILGTGNPKTRRFFNEKALSLGGKPYTYISPGAKVSKFNVEIGEGSCLLQGVIIEACTKIGKGSLINVRSTIHHDTVIEDYVEIAPGSILLGGAKIGMNAFIGASAVIGPKIKIGQDSIVGAGSVVLESCENNLFIAGTPAKVIKNNKKQGDI